MSEEYRGCCFCGSVQLIARGKPLSMGYCHCSDCRAWSAGPINTFTLWNPDSVLVISGHETIGTYHKTENTYRKWCKVCGGHIMSEHPSMNLIDIYAPIIQNLAFKPEVHVFYSEKVVSVKDGLPKMKGMPSEMGGSGETLPE